MIDLEKSHTHDNGMQRVNEADKSSGPRVEVEDVTSLSPTSTMSSTLQKNVYGLHLVRHRPRTFFEGPRDIQRHSKLPLCIRLYGGILPNMILPLLFAGIWSTGINLIHHFVVDIGEW
jgi:hypothetical protein